MDRPRSLADVLGIPDPSIVDGPRELPASVNFDTLTGKDFARAVLDSADFRRYIVAGLAAGDLAPAVLTRLMDHGWGKPVEKFEVKDTTNPLENQSIEQLKERAAFLMRVINALEDDDQPRASVH